MYESFIKPIGDFIAALILSILIAPIALILMIILNFVNDGSPFFFQRRAGKHGKPFNIIKFKSMTDKTDENGELLPSNERLTPIGNFIRKYSLDEIPQIWHVLKGEMSFVGPRPLHTEYLPFYDEVQARRHEVICGITGWAQVNGRNTITWEKKFEYDVYYVDHQSFILDMKILFLTVYKVLKKKDVNSSDDLDMPAFKNIKFE